MAEVYLSHVRKGQHNAYTRTETWVNEEPKVGTLRQQIYLNSLFRVDRAFMVYMQSISSLNAMLYRPQYDHTLQDMTN
jgi:hypothetical protein